MRYPTPCLEGVLERRYKRFFADVRLGDGALAVSHCVNTGRMTGCAEPGFRARISAADNPKRALRWTLEQVHDGNTWIGVNTRLANALAIEALAAGLVPSLTGYATVLTEQRYGENSRIDVLLGDHPERSGQRCFVEVKSTTLAEGDVALFPDAVTARGTKHMHELRRQVEAGERAAILYCVQRDDCAVFRPADAIDPGYGMALREALAAGVEAYAFTVRPTSEGLEVGQALVIEVEP